jgi:hypothetical protein
VLYLPADAIHFTICRQISVVRDECGDNGVDVRLHKVS